MRYPAVSTKRPPSWLPQGQHLLLAALQRNSRLRHLACASLHAPARERPVQSFASAHHRAPVFTSTRSLSYSRGPVQYSTQCTVLEQGPLQQGPRAVLPVAVWEWECTWNHRHLGRELEITLRENGPANGRLAVDDVDKECRPPAVAGDILVRDVFARAGTCFRELGFRP
jgi:hypothetical protein